MKPIRVRRSTLTPERILDLLMAQSTGSRVRPHIIPATIARCMAPRDALAAHNRVSDDECSDQVTARECAAYSLRVAYSGTRDWYCTRSGCECAWRREDWKQSPVPVIEPGNGPVRYHVDTQAAVIVPEIHAAFARLLGDDSRAGAAARAWITGDWSAVDAMNGKRGRTRGLVENRTGAQMEMAQAILDSIGGAK